MMRLSCGASTHFNSQPHKEADVTVDSKYRPYIISTHSLTRRLTVPLLQSYQRMIYFNSQPHKEADAIKRLQRFSPKPFQLTASQGG